MRCVYQPREAEYFSREGWTGIFDLPVGQINERHRVGWVGPTGPAFGRPNDKLRDTHPLQFAKVMGFREALEPSWVNPNSPALATAFLR
jgi:hypothetical protein